MTGVLLAGLSAWLVLQALGLAALPITRRVLRCLPDQGYAFSKIVGLLLVSYGVWAGASAGLVTNSLGGVVLVLAVVSAVSAWLGLRGGLEEARAFFHSRRGQIVAVEVLFLLTLLAWTVLRAYAPSKIVSAYGEKYMEIAFLNGILRSPQFPPLDPWMAGYAISYYYFGYVMMAVFTRLAGVAPTVGFDLYDAALFALSACGAYGVVSNLVLASRGTRRAATGFGLLGSLFTVGLGNLEGVIHGLHSARALPAAFLAWIDIPKLASDPQSGLFYPGHDFYVWWWWRASRVLNDVDLFGQPTGLEPITEFPFFSFLLGDNHPHKLALPFVLLAVGMAFNLLLLRSGSPGRSRDEIFVYLAYALVLGGLAFLNTWDFPIYLGLTLLAFAAGEAARARGSESGGGWGGVLRQSARAGLGLGAAAIGLYFFFYLGFASQAGGLLPYLFPPTRLPQYLVMFGPFALILACFLLAALWRSGGRGALALGGRVWLGLALGLYGAYLLLLAAAGALLNAGMLVPGGFANPDVQRWTGGLAPAEVLARVAAARGQNPWTFLFLSVLIAAGLAALWANLRGRIESGPLLSGPLENGTLFAVLLGVAGLALTLSVEFVYLRDLFGARMNTVFKFYFQAWVLMACASAYGLWWLTRPGTLAPPVRAALGVAVTALVAAGLVYPVMGAYSRAHGFQYPPDIDATATLAGRYPGHWNSYPDDWAAIEWLRDRVETGSPENPPVILEASAGSYNHAGRFSAFTGFPTVLGWDYHEYQWRGSYDEPNRRLADIRAIYTTANPDLALSLIRRWQVRYVILGDAERGWIERTCQQPETTCNARRAIEKFDRMLTPVFVSGGTTVYAVPE